MVRTTKSTSAPAVSVPVVPDVSASTTKPRAKKVKVEVVPAPVVEVSVSSSTEVVSVVEPSSIASRMTEFNAKLQQLVSLFSTVKNDFKTLEKAVTREMKIAQKASSKKRKSNGNRKPSGFIKPTRISDELAAFLSKTVGTEMARTDVSKEINAYIQSNQLQDKSNGRKINADAKLSALLKITPADELTYFNLQRFMKHHFIKETPVATA
jgi:chromatin remodeling complex protein RSC6